jgi:hypothetical protein
MTEEAYIPDTHIHEAAHVVVARCLGGEVFLHKEDQVGVTGMPDEEALTSVVWAGMLADYRHFSHITAEIHLQACEHLVEHHDVTNERHDPNKLVALAKDDRAMVLRACRRARKVLMRHWHEVLETSMATR